MASDRPVPDPETDLPNWARIVRRQFNGISLVIGGLALVVVAVLGLWDKVPDWPSGLDCSDYSNLSTEEIEECQARLR